MGAVLKRKLLSHIGAWCLVPPALSSTPVTHSGIELRQPKSIQQTQRFALQFLSLISHPVPSVQYIPRDATKLKSRSVYAFPLACAAKEDALRTRRSSHSNAQGVSARDGESKERSGEEAERFWYTYPSRNTMDDQAMLMARIRTIDRLNFLLCWCFWQAQDDPARDARENKRAKQPMASSYSPRKEEKPVASA